jgi:hypothetical protein
VAAKTATYFEVRELDGGKSSLSFDYRLAAKRRGYETQRLEPAPLGSRLGTSSLDTAEQSVGNLPGSTEQEAARPMTARTTAPSARPH